MTAASGKMGVVIVGHVDHGKSTLIGRLLHDTDSLMDGKHDEVKAACTRRGVTFEWSFLLDAFQAERDQAITIDTTQIWFKSQKRDYVIIDAPGHREFLKNMVSGAAQADAAILIVDARDGVREQTRRHACLLRLLGLSQIVVIINKMDAVGYSQERYAEVSGEIGAYLQSNGLTPKFIIPAAAWHGENIAQKSANMTWYHGPCLLEALDQFTPVKTDTAFPLRFPVQDVYHFNGERIIVGRIQSGTISRGDKVIFSPSGAAATVTGIKKWNVPCDILTAEAGDSIGITLDQPVFVARGDTACHEEGMPHAAHEFSADVFWLGKKPLKEGQSCKIRSTTDETVVTVRSIRGVVNIDDFSRTEKNALETNEIAEVWFHSRKPLALDPSSRIVLIDGYDVAGGAVVRGESLASAQKNVFAVDHMLTAQDRARRNGHAGAVIWLTGLSGSGKSTLAMRAEHLLHKNGIQAYVLDGDNVRHGLCSDLGFSPQDRSENIRRVGEVAALMADAGIVVITSFISPFDADRRRARDISGDVFHEVYVKASLDACERRDPKGLYKKARKGEIPHFTGIASPYEPPTRPELTIDTEQFSLEKSLESLASYIMNAVALKAPAAKKRAQSGN